MNLRNWSKYHTAGLILGILTTLVAIPVAAFLYSKLSGDTDIFRKIKFLHQDQARILSLASIANLFWFHRFIKKENFPVAMGVIIATAANLVLVVVLKYVL